MCLQSSTIENESRVRESVSQLENTKYALSKVNMDLSKSQKSNPAARERERTLPEVVPCKAARDKCRSSKNIQRRLCIYRYSEYQSISTQRKLTEHDEIYHPIGGLVKIVRRIKRRAHLWSSRKRIVRAYHFGM